jgi:hypothetical protein
MSPIPGHHLSEPAWRRVKGGAWVALTVVFVVLLIRAENKSDEAIDRVTRVESPCLKYGAKSDQCKEAFEQAVLTITHAQACAILRKAGLEIQPCAHARLRQEVGRRKERAASGGQRERVGGDAPQPGPTGPQISGPRKGGSDGDGGTGKQWGGDGGGPDAGGDSPAAESPASPDPGSVSVGSPPDPSPGRSSDAPGDPEPKPSFPGTVPSTVEGVGGVVKEAGEEAGKAVEGLGEAAGCALRKDC